jgi:hypothetical protein
MPDAKVASVNWVKAHRIMGKIVEFPIWRPQRLPLTEATPVAEIVIFPGVRIERDDGGRQAHLEAARPPRRISSGLSDEREH